MYKIKNTSTTALQSDVCISDYTCSDTCVNSNVASGMPKKSNSLGSVRYTFNGATSKTSHPQSSVVPLMVLHSSDRFERSNAMLLHVTSVA